MRFILTMMVLLLLPTVNCSLFREEKKTHNGDKFTVAQAHKKFAISLNGKVWKLLAKKKLTQAEKSEMLYAAYGSGYHWLRVGTVVNRQRGEWLIARVNSQLEYCDSAMRHAKNCERITNRNMTKMKGFDIAYSLEAMARANAVCDNTKEAEKYFVRAKSASRKINSKDDRNLFMRDLYSGNWNGIVFE